MAERDSAVNSAEPHLWGDYYPLVHYADRLPVDGTIVRRHGANTMLAAEDGRSWPAFACYPASLSPGGERKRIPTEQEGSEIASVDRLFEY